MKMNLYSDFIEHWESQDYEFPCTEHQFYHRAESFIFDPKFVASDYIDESEMTPGWQMGLVNRLLKEGGVSIE
jgi:hypothetical protein